MFQLQLLPETLNQISIMVGLFLPLLVAYLVRVNTSRQVKQSIVLSMAIAAAIFIVAVKDGIAYDNADAVVRTVFLIVGAAQTFYITLWRLLSAAIIEKLEKIQPPLPTMVQNLLR